MSELVGEVGLAGENGGVEKEWRKGRRGWTYGVIVCRCSRFGERLGSGCLLLDMLSRRRNGRLSYQRTMVFVILVVTIRTSGDVV